MLLLDEWHRRGVELVFLNRPLGQSPEDDLLLKVQGIVAECERAKIMERSRRGKKHAAQNGSLNVMAGAPFGYRYVSVREGGGRARFEPVAEQARAVQQIFSQRCAKPLTHNCAAPEMDFIDAVRRPLVATIPHVVDHEDANAGNR